MKKKVKCIFLYNEYVLIYSRVEKGQRARSGAWMLILKGFENVIRDYVFITERIILVSFWTNNTISNTFKSLCPWGL